MFLPQTVADIFLTTIAASLSRNNNSVEYISMDPSPPSFVGPSYSTQPPGTNGANQYNAGYTTQPGVAPYYPQPYYYPPMQQQKQQQQQTSVVVQLGQQQHVTVKPALSFVGPIVLSVIVFFSCLGLFGLIAFILAVVGFVMDGDQHTRRQFYHASVGISIAGIVTGVIFYIIIIVVSVAA